jgi:hypothetical protein
VYTQQEENGLFLLIYNFSENGMCQDKKKKITLFDQNMASRRVSVHRTRRKWPFFAKL